MSLVGSFCIARLGDGNSEGQEANARLIASAPDLLAELEDITILECPDCDGTGYEQDGTKDNACHRCGGFGEIIRGGHPAGIRAAIARAKGEA